MSHGWNWRTTINKPGSFRKSKVPCQAKRPWCCHHVHHRTPSAQRKRLDTKVAVMGTSRTPREHGPSKKPGWRPYQRSLFLSARDFHKTRLDIVCVSLFATVVHLPSAFIMLGTCFHACHFRPICTGSAQSDIKYIYIYIYIKKTWNTVRSSAANGASCLTHFHRICTKMITWTICFLHLVLFYKI